MLVWSVSSNKTFPKAQLSEIKTFIPLGFWSTIQGADFREKGKYPGWAGLPLSVCFQRALLHKLRDNRCPEWTQKTARRFQRSSFSWQGHKIIINDLKSLFRETLAGFPLTKWMDDLAKRSLIYVEIKSKLSHLAHIHLIYLSYPFIVSL